MFLLAPHLAGLVGLLASEPSAPPARGGARLLHGGYLALGTTCGGAVGLSAVAGRAMFLRRLGRKPPRAGR